MGGIWWAFSVTGRTIRLMPFSMCISSAGQCPSEKGCMACHHQGCVDPQGLQQAEHSLSQMVGGPETLGTEDGGGPAGDGLPMRKGCPSNPDPLMFCILAVAYLELDGHLRPSQQPQGAEEQSHRRRRELHPTGPMRPNPPTDRVGRTQASTPATQSTATVVLAATSGVRGSKETPISTGSVPAPAAKGKGKNVPPAAKGKGKDVPPASKAAPPAYKGKGKEAPPAGKVKGKEAPPEGKGKGPAPAGRKERKPGAGTESKPPTQTMELQPCEAAAEGLEPPPTAGCTDTSTTASRSSPSGQRSEAAGEGLEPPPLLAAPTPAPLLAPPPASPPAPPPAPLPATPVGSRLRLQGKGWCTPTTACTTSSTTVSSSSPSGKPLEAAGEGLEPPPTTGCTDTSTATGTCTTTCTITCTATSTTASSSSPSGQPSRRAGASPTTGSTDTSTGTATTEQASPPVGSV
ncbi:hypothetical protein NDU88_003947 [Pleurodeles waltl]|uniref:Uncharacterized protein n=1 Tax=Pleurodeles waltl TaxID=8319 RepID=A0AAV7WSN8_PLEWA|nr:hypothetical protein NDU88_003947 [Pleurodeles waltl]